MALYIHVEILHTAVQALVYARRAKSGKLQPGGTDLVNAIGHKPKDVLGALQRYRDKRIRQQTPSFNQDNACQALS